MSKWTPAQEEIMKEFRFLGKKAVAELICEKTGVKRTEDAVKRHASRIGVSLAKYFTCPQCGRRVERLNRNSGLCPLCNERTLLDGQRMANLRILREIRRNASDPDIAKYRRAHSAVRQENSRLMRKHGVGGKREFNREARDGESVNMSPEMSLPRSAAQKVLEEANEAND